MLKKKFPTAPHIYRKFRGVADIYVGESNGKLKYFYLVIY